MSTTPQDMADSLSMLVREKLSVRGADLSTQSRRIGRRAPRSVRRDLHAVAHAASLGTHKRMAMQVNTDRVAQAHKRARQWLRDYDAQATRRQRLRAILAALVFNFALAIGLGIWALAHFDLIGP